MSKTIYDHNKIEEKWLSSWESQQLFQQTENQPNTQEKEYVLFAFAYPSGSGLHVGHVESKTALDILARYHRMQGKSVFFPVGWDAFGLPAENYAIKTGVAPAVTTKNAIDTFRRQIKRIGISYDWANEIATSHPEYYKWTQWIFLQLFHKGLAYKQLGAVNWCPSCQTVLANEQVVNGECERCGTQVIQKSMDQWFFKISVYKDQLISGLDQVDWPEPTKQQQLHWIGKSEGVNVQFSIFNSQINLTCFTTRVDTIFGVSFIVISPEKFAETGLLNFVDDAHERQVSAYMHQAEKKTEEERKKGEKHKTGVDTGLKAINPVNGQEVPIFVADYVLAGYGTGVVMGVPAHDERDLAFARKFSLPTVQVIDTGRTEENGFFGSEEGSLVNSGEWTGLNSSVAQQKITEHFSSSMKKTTTYRLRDWLISRQRYWGTPIPIVYDPEGKAHPVKEEHLPWTLPTDVEFKPTGESPLTHSVELKDRVEKLYGKGWRPEYDTMDTFVDSSWYFLRYVDSRNPKAFASEAQIKHWLPVDLYMNGPEHIVLHLLYSRFFTKFLRDEGYLHFDEPFMKMRHQGMILGPDGKKMSKSKGNVINPDEVIEKYGADTLRVYEMFMGPLEADKPWNTNSVVGIYRFLNRIFHLINTEVNKQTSHTSLSLSKEVERKLHQTIKKVTEDIPLLKFNTAIAAMMELVNIWEAEAKVNPQQILHIDDIKSFIKILCPFAPFLAEELLSQIKDSDTSVSIHLSSWPVYDEAILVSEEVQIVVQVNGKLRGQLMISLDQAKDQETVFQEAKSLEKIQPWLEGKTIMKEIYVPQKLVNFVVQ